MEPATTEAVVHDAELIALARTHEARAEEAFRSLYERYRDEVFAFLVRLLQDEALAEDVLQEAFLRVYRNLDRYHPERSFRAWLYQITRNAALDALRVKRKEERLAGESARRPLPADVVEEVSRLEDAARTRDALDALPPEVRALLIQRHGVGMTLAEIAESWSCTERTILTRLRTALALLGQKLAGGVR